MRSIMRWTLTLFSSCHVMQRHAAIVHMRQTAMMLDMHVGTLRAGQAVADAGLIEVLQIESSN